MRPSRILDRLGDVLSMGCRLLLVGILVLINVEIAGRYLVGYSTKISDEYSGYMFTWIVMLGLLYTHRSGAMLQVRALIDVLPARGRRILEIFNCLLGAVLTLIAGYGAYKMTAISWQFQSTSAFISRTPLFIPQAVIPLGFALLFLSFVEGVWRGIVGRPSVEEKADHWT